MNEDLARISELIQPAHSIAVIVGSQVTLDQAAAALALTRSLRQVGKEVGLYAPEQPSLSTELIDLADLKTEFGNQNLIISFDYHESSVDKVSYAISQDASKFFLTIRPKKGSPPLDPTTVEFNYAGTDCDLLILIGEHDLTNLRQLYFGYEDVFSSVPMISLNSFRSGIGAIALDVSSYSSYSEYMTLLLGGMQFEIDAEAATNLYVGLAFETKAFTSATTTAETFEIVAELLRRGARRSHELLTQLTQSFVKDPDHQVAIKQRDVEGDALATATPATTQLKPSSKHLKKSTSTSASLKK